MTGGRVLVSTQGPAGLVAAVVECACTCPGCPAIEGRSWRDAERQAELRMWAACPDGRWFCPACADAGHIAPPPLDYRMCDCGHAHPWPCTCRDCRGAAA